MQFEEFDKKIRDAAEHHHPAYDEKAWDKMEILLDKHMPVKRDDRRRFIFFLLFLFILGSGAYLFIRNYTRPVTTLSKQTNPAGSQATVAPLVKETKAANTVEKPETEIKTGSTDKTKAAEDGGIAAVKNTPVTPAPDRKQKSSPFPLPGEINAAAKGLISKNKNNPLKNPGKLNIQKQTGQGLKPVAGPIVIKTKKSNSPKPINPVDISTDPILKTPDPSGAAQTANGNPKEAITITTGQPDTALQKVTNTEAAQPKPAEIASKKKQAQKTGKQQQSPFAITATAGPDLSFIGLRELGKLKIKYGAGVSYSIRRFAVRTGFYVTSKVYSADGAYYHPFYASLEKVDGDCKVYEIPLTVTYNFAGSKNHNWFASTGLSSYLMKKETYGYHSKDPWTGAYSYYEKTWKNKNNHYFSVLNLSAGYERKFSNTVSLIAEPYLQLPLTGIGNGKMKLNSAGILLTLSVRPFGVKK